MELAALARQLGVDIDDGAGVPAIFHAVCAALVPGSGDHDWRTRAAARVAHVLAGRYGLREVLAVTEMSGGALADRTDRSVRAALVALGRADREPWDPALADALAETARLAGVTPRARHPSGLPLGEIESTCARCAWRAWSRDRVVCQQAEGPIDDAWSACERFEAALDCQDCGACCREAYHSVEVKRDDPAIVRLPQYMVDRGTYVELRRDGDRCAALAGGGGERYRCVVYDDRPRTCREFAAGTSACLLARRRVGTSE